MGKLGRNAEGHHVSHPVEMRKSGIVKGQPFELAQS